MTHQGPSDTRANKDVLERQHFLFGDWVFGSCFCLFACLLCFLFFLLWGALERWGETMADQEASGIGCMM